MLIFFLFGAIFGIRRLSAIIRIIEFLPVIIITNSYIVKHYSIGVFRCVLIILSILLIAYFIVCVALAFSLCVGESSEEYGEFIFKKSIFKKTYCLLFFTERKEKFYEDEDDNKYTIITLPATVYKSNVVVDKKIFDLLNVSTYTKIYISVKNGNQSSSISEIFYESKKFYGSVRDIQIEVKIKSNNKKLITKLKLLGE